MEQVFLVPPLTLALLLIALLVAGAIVGIVRLGR